MITDYLSSLWSKPTINKRIKCLQKLIAIETKIESEGSEFVRTSSTESEMNYRQFALLYKKEYERCKEIIKSIKA